MCKYCERRTDVKLGWDQPELPWHHNQDITRNISGNMIHTDDTVGVIHDYQTASPVLIIKRMALAQSTSQSNSVRNVGENWEGSQYNGRIRQQYDCSDRKSGSKSNSGRKSSCNQMLHR